jgi:hypothetical protein
VASGPPSAGVRAELVGLLAADSTRLGQVYVRRCQGKDAATIARELGVGTPGFVSNYDRAAEALLDGNVPTGRTVAGNAASVFRGILRKYPRLSPEARSYLEAKHAELMRHADGSGGPVGLPQFIVPYKAQGFPAGVVDRAGSLRFTDDDLAHALFTTGRAPGDEFKYGYASFWEWVHRVSLMLAYIRRARRGSLVRSELVSQLDRSEKAPISYALGQALTGIFCAELLSVRFLMHVDRYYRDFGVTFGLSRRRPDLFGQKANGDWVVAEAKGRFNSMEAGLHHVLAAQKRAITRISGDPPAITLGCVTSFPKGSMRVDAFDPDEDGIESIELNIDPDRFMLAYYEPFLMAINSGEPDENPADDNQVLAARLSIVNLRVGILRSIADRIRAASLGEIDGLAESVKSTLDQTARLPGFSDGTVVEADWSAFFSAQ